LLTPHPFKADGRSPGGGSGNGHRNFKNSASGFGLLNCAEDEAF